MTRKGIIHRDLKPENILFNSKSEGVFDIRLADFGYATASLSAEASSSSDDDVVCGTPGYIAPEALDGDGFTFKSDIFSVGSILFSMLTLKNLFAGNDYKTVMNNNTKCSLDHLPHKMRACSAAVRDLTK
jgi:serine/threonine protein kinase